MNDTTARRGWARGQQGGGAIAVVAVVVTLLLAACGGDDKKEPTQVPTQAAPPTSATTATGSPGPGGSTTSGTPVAGGTTVGQLADAIAAAWPTTSYRRLETSGPLETLAATPTASGNLTTVDEVLYPGQVHRTITSGDRAVGEFILTDGKLYARGDYVTAVIDPSVDGSTWVEVDPSALSPSSPAGNMAAQIASLLKPRFDGLSADERNRAATPLGPTTIDGRNCDAYKTVETTSTGEARDIVIAVTSDGQLCAVISQGGGQATIEIYTFGAQVTIAPPEGAATPAPAAASPAASAVASPVE